MRLTSRIMEAILPYLVLSKTRGNILDQVAFPIVWINTKGVVASRIMGHPPYLDRSKMSVASRLMVDSPFIWFYPKLGFRV